MSEDYRCKDIGVTADKYVILDSTSDLIDTVEVTGNGSASEVNVLTDLRITDVCKVSCSCILVDLRTLDLDVCTDRYMIFDQCSGSYM